MLRKNLYQGMLITYKKRRDLAKVKGKNTKSLTKKVKAIKRSLSIIERREKKVKELALRIKEFTGIDVRGKGGKTNTQTTLAKALFYKVGLESGIKGPWLQKYTGAKHASTPYELRKQFTRLLKDDPKRLDFWNRWKQFILLYEDTE